MPLAYRTDRSIGQSRQADDRLPASRRRGSFGRALLLAGACAAFGPAAMAAEWNGITRSTEDSRSADGVVTHQEICGFDLIRFRADVSGGRVSLVLQNGDRTFDVSASAGGGGRVSQWFNFWIGSERVDMKLTGTLGDRAFLGRIYGNYETGDLRDPGERICRAIMVMAAPPLTPRDVIDTRRSMPEAEPEAVFAALDSRQVASAPTAQPAPAPQAQPQAPQGQPPAPQPPSQAPLAQPQMPQTSPDMPPAAPGAPDSGTAALRQQLAFLKGLWDDGLIDEYEWDRRRRALLDEAFGRTPETQPQPENPFARPPGATQEIALAPASGPVPGSSRQFVQPGPSQADLADISWGNYYALVIGINDYQNLPKLETAINDALRVADLLERLYGFKVQKLINPTRQEIVDAFDVLRETLGGDDNLLIYYAGHGWLDDGSDRGYWLPIDAQPNRRGNWVSNATITDTLKTLLAKHVMIVADSCFSGTLTRNAPVSLRGADYWQRIAQKAARVTLTSGGLEPVADNNGSGHSPFAAAFIDVLEENTSVIDGTSLFSAMRRPVILSANQTPEYSDVRAAGHDGGDFVFVRKR